MRKVLWGVFAVSVVALVTEAVLHPLGAGFAIGVRPVPSGTPWTYQLLSGFVPALTVLTLAGSAAGLYHLKNCHEDGCWRLGKHHINGSPWCNRHHENARRLKTDSDRLDRVIELLEGLQSAPEPAGSCTVCGRLVPCRTEP